MQWKLARGDTAGVREEFRTLRQARQSLRPGDVAFDGTYHEARLLLAIGDTTQAVRLLDLSLEALPTLGTDLIDQVPQVATLVRGMALRAELAASAGDTVTAKRWARDVSLLWSGGDPELQSILSRMHAISPGS
jgi:hypothetical protein